MKNYMVDVQLPEIPDEDYIAKIPDQRMMFNRLMDKGVVTGYALSSDRSKLWIMISAASERQVWDILKKMPLYHYMSASVEELAFNETYHHFMVQPSLN